MFHLYVWYVVPCWTLVHPRPAIFERSYIHGWSVMFEFYINGLVPDCGNSSALEIELLPSWTKLLIYELQKILNTSEILLNSVLSTGRKKLLSVMWCCVSFWCIYTEDILSFPDIRCGQTFFHHSPQLDSKPLIPGHQLISGTSHLASKNINSTLTGAKILLSHIWRLHKCLE